MSITVRFDPTSVSPQSQIIPDATEFNDGVMTAEQVQELDALAAEVAGIVAGPSGVINVYSPSGVGAPMRPAASAVGAVVGVTAVLVVNFDDKQLNYSDGVNWRDFAGNLT